MLYTTLEPVGKLKVIFLITGITSIVKRIFYEISHKNLIHKINCFYKIIFHF